MNGHSFGGGQSAVGTLKQTGYMTKLLMVREIFVAFKHLSTLCAVVHCQQIVSRFDVFIVFAPENKTKYKNRLSRGY